MSIKRFQQYNRKEFAKQQFEHCLNLIKMVCNHRTKCLHLKSKYYDIFLTIKFYVVHDDGCAKCKQKYFGIFISGESYQLVEEDVKVLSYDCHISQFFVGCVCNEVDKENINVEYELEPHEVTQSYDLLFKFEADNLCPEYVAIQDDIQTATWPFAPSGRCLI